MECHVLAAAEREKCGGRQSRASEKDRWTNLKFDGSRDGKWEKESVRNVFTRSWKCAQIHSLPLLSRRYVGFHALVISSILLKERRERERERASHESVRHSRFTGVRCQTSVDTGNSCSRDYPHLRGRFHGAVGIFLTPHTSILKCS